jgi:hypothetical protein
MLGSRVKGELLKSRAHFFGVLAAVATAVCVAAFAFALYLGWRLYLQAQENGACSNGPRKACKSAAAPG